MGVRRIFSRGGKVDISLIVFRLLTMQRKWTHTKRVTLLHHKENTQCYGNSCIQCFPSKKILHWANICCSEYGYFKTKLAEF